MKLQSQVDAADVIVLLSLLRSRRVTLGGTFPKKSALWSVALLVLVRLERRRISWGFLVVPPPSIWLPS